MNRPYDSLPVLALLLALAWLPAVVPSAVFAAATGELPADILQLIRDAKPLTPAQALAAMHTEPGLRVELAASEPLTGDPVALAFDERGRLFVVENRGYPEGAPDGSPMGVIALLEDTNRDGAFDKRTEFATGLTFPNGITCWRGGVFVTCAPDVLYLKDTDGDGKADVRKAVLTGFELGKTTQIRVATPVLGPDGWIHLTSGLTGGNVHSPEAPRAPVAFKKNDSRFHPDTFLFETFPGASQFGLAFDDFGRKHTVDNRHPLQMLVLAPRHLQRNPWLPFSETIADIAPSGEAGKVFPLARDQTTASMHTKLLHTPHAGTFTSACGIGFFGGDALPSGFDGNAFTCEPAQALVQRQVIRPDGAIFRADPGVAGASALVTADSWFRPVFVTTGPDGALYVASMYRKFIDHPQYVPAEMRGQLDFISGRGQGRIYRLVAAEAKPVRRAFDLGRESTRSLVGTLGDTNAFLRQTAFRLLLERNDPAAPKALERLLDGRKTSPQAKALALRVLEAQGALTTDHVRGMLEDPSPGVREVALQLGERWLDTPAAAALGHRLNLGTLFPTGGDELAALITAALQLTADPEPRVRFQSVLTLGVHDYPGALRRFAEVAVRDAGDRWTRAAVLAAAGGKPVDSFEAVLARIDFNRRAAANDALQSLLTEFGRVLGASQPPATLTALVKRITTAPQLDGALQAAAISGLGDAAQKRKLPLAKLASGDTVASDGLARVIGDAATLAVDSGASTPRRQSAIGLLAFADPAQAAPVLQELISPQHATEIQAAAVKAYFAVAADGASRFLVTPARWKSLSPPVREAAIAGLLSQPSGVATLLDAMEAGAVAPASLNPARRAQLSNHRDKVLAARAEGIFAGLTGGDRMKAYEELKGALKLKGNAESGRAVFARACASCHRLGSEGAMVGPDLTGIRNQPAEVLLLHIIVPSQEIVAGFNSYEIETTDGRTVGGLLASESPASVTLRRALGEEETILRTQIASMTSGALSLMPDELEKTMTRQELRDLIAWLRGE